MSKSTKCKGCGNRTTAYRYCRSCKSKRHHAFKRIKAEGMIVDEAGGGWWIWDAKGKVIVIGKDTKSEALDAFAFEDVTTGDDA